MRKTGVYIDLDLDGRMRTSMLATMTLEGHLSLSEFVCRSVPFEVARLEARYNDSVPFRRANGGNIPRGRPLGD